MHIFLYVNISIIICIYFYMYICIYIYTYIYVLIYIYIYIYILMYIFMYFYFYVYIYIYMYFYRCMYVYMYVNIYIGIYIYINKGIHLFMYIYIYILYLYIYVYIEPPTITRKMNLSWRLSHFSGHVPHFIYSLECCPLSAIVFVSFWLFFMLLGKSPKRCAHVTFHPFPRISSSWTLKGTVPWPILTLHLKDVLRPTSGAESCL